MTLKKCINCVFYSKHGQFRQGSPRCLHVDYIMDIPDPTYHCSSFVIRDIVLQKTLLEMEAEEQRRLLTQAEAKERLISTKVSVIEFAKTKGYKHEVRQRGINMR